MNERTVSILWLVFVGILTFLSSDYIQEQAKVIYFFATLEPLLQKRKAPTR